MIRVVVTGSECTGKTTLARALAEHYRVPWASEYVRRFVDEKGGPVAAGDVEEIARGQLAGEDRAATRAHRLVVLDTDLLSTVVYSRHYFGGCPAWVEEALEERRGDLYLLAGIDVPWVPDGDQRDRGDRRAEMQALFRDALRLRRWPTLEIQGPPEVRLSAAIRAVDGLLHRGGAGAAADHTPGSRT